MLKVNRAIQPHQFLFTEPASARKGANAALYQSTCCSAKKGDFFLWAGVKAIGRLFASILSSIWQLICCCPSAKEETNDLPWLSEELVEQFLEDQDVKTVTKISDGVFEVDFENRLSTTMRFSMNKKAEIILVDDNYKGEKNLGPSFVFPRLKNGFVPDTIPYYHRGEVHYLEKTKYEPESKKVYIQGMAPDKIREKFKEALNRTAYGGKPHVVWESHLTKNPDADLKWLNSTIVAASLGLQGVDKVVHKDEGTFELTHLGKTEEVEFYINTLNELVIFFKGEGVQLIEGLSVTITKDGGMYGREMFVYDFGKCYTTTVKDDLVNMKRLFIGKISQGFMDTINDAEGTTNFSDGATYIWKTTDPDSITLLEANGFKYDEARKAWVRAAKG